MSEIRKRILKQAADLVTICQRSEFAADYPKSMPVSALKDIEKQNARLSDVAVELRQISDKLPT